MPRREHNPTANMLSQVHETFREMKADYRIAQSGPFTPRPKGVQATGSNADWHWRDQSRYFLGVERARDWDRNNLVIAQGVDRLCDNVLGEEGPQLLPTPWKVGTRKVDRGLARELTDRFYGWADDPLQADITGQYDLWEQAWLVLRAAVIDGDILPLPTNEESLQLIENHRCRSPYNATRSDKYNRLALGVNHNEHNRATEFWITREDVGVNQRVSNITDCVRYPAFGDDGEPAVFHFKLARRSSQTRGVSLLAPCADAVGMHDDLQFAKLVQAQVVSCFAIIEQMTGDGPAPPKLGSAADNNQLGGRNSETRDDGSDEIREAIGPGMRVRAKKGIKYEAFSPNTPNETFFPHAMMILSFIAVNLKMPVAVLLMDPSNTNFSGWRGAMDEARKGFRYLQNRLNKSFFRLVYRWKIRQFAASDQALAKRLQEDAEGLLSHAWQSPAWDYIEPMKDASADLLQVRNALISQRRRCAKRNMNWRDLSREIVEDNALLIFRAAKTAERLNKKLGYAGSPKEITWREVACAPTPDGMTISMSNQEAADPALPAKPVKNGDPWTTPEIPAL